MGVKEVRCVLIFRLSGGSGGSAVCVIEEFSRDLLRLSWAGEFESIRRGEFIVSLQGSSRAVSDIDIPDLVSGTDFIDPNEPFVKISLLSGERFWLVMMQPSEVDDPLIVEALRRDAELNSDIRIGRSHEEVMQTALERL